MGVEVTGRNPLTPSVPCPRERTVERVAGPAKPQAICGQRGASVATDKIET
jgi:hypothetical protein